MKTALEFLKKEAVLSIAAVFAVASMFFVPPDAEYLGYIDLRVLALLFCLMIVVAGFQRCGLFNVFAQELLTKQKDIRSLTVVLVMLPFFTSMFVTNDVALITFVPFTFPVLIAANAREITVKIIVLQTLAANLGSILTPVGNPQNLYLYSCYDFSIGEFFKITVPLTLVSMVVLFAASFLTKNRRIDVQMEKTAKIRNPYIFTVYLCVFILCLLTVFRVVHYIFLLVAVIIVFAITDPQLFKYVDYALLVTFVFFFIFSGNLGRIPAISEFLNSIMEKNTLLASALASQVISNVPAAVLLSGFTKNGADLLAGVDIGGLGTPVASLASLISLKFYINSDNSKPLEYLIFFLFANFAGFAALLLFYCIL